MMTTLNQIRKEGPCTSGWVTLLTHLGKTRADDAPLSIATILKSNSLDDAIWSLCAVQGYDREIRLFAVWCARQVEHLLTDPRSIAALQVAEAFANGEATQEQLSTAYSAARSADSTAYSAARSADSAARSAAYSAYSAARSAAYSADSAAYSAARSAAYSADSAARSAARSAAYSAADSAARSADSAARSAAYSAAHSAARSAQAARLLEICTATKE